MKNVKKGFWILGLVAVLFVIIIPMKPALPEQPSSVQNLTNLVRCNDERGKIKLVYGPSGFNYSRHPGGFIVPNNRVVGTESIDVQDTFLGSLITVQDQALTQPDNAFFAVTLVLPQVNLYQMVKKVELNTVIKETMSRTSIAGDRLVLGAIQESSFYPVVCTVERAQERKRNRNR